MTRFGLSLAGAGLGVIGWIASASAQVITGYVLPGAYLRAGPAVEYPLISTLPPGAPAAIYGCLDGWSWCDVEVQGLRGWTAGPGLQVLYGQERVGLALYAPRLFVPVIGFELGSYWGRYYNNRPFYGDRDRWIGFERDHPTHGGDRFERDRLTHGGDRGPTQFGHDPYRADDGRPLAHPPILGYHQDTPRAPDATRDTRNDRGQPAYGAQERHDTHNDPTRLQPQARPQAQPQRHDDHQDSAHHDRDRHADSPPPGR